jgi:glycosyltransferase involved in cell wall biosynthesis
MKVEKLTIIIPAFNEDKTIIEILERLKMVELQQDIEKEIIIIDDCSTDQTQALSQNYIAQNPGQNIRLIVNDRNLGKGAAIREALSYVTGDYMVIQDADLELDPEEINALLVPVLRAGADMVNGSRYMGGNPRRMLFFWHTMANKMITFLSNIFSGFYLTDMVSCYKLFRTDIIRHLNLSENRFGFETEFIAKISKIPGLKIYEVGISYYGRNFEDGKKLGFMDFFRIIYCIVKYNLFTSKSKIYKK